MSSSFDTAIILCNYAHKSPISSQLTHAECASLSLDNGDMTFTNGVAINSVATHTCDPGYRLLPEGGQVRTCSTDGWSGQDVTCSEFFMHTVTSWGVYSWTNGI